jgi:hypothetical protein
MKMEERGRAFAYLKTLLLVNVEENYEAPVGIIVDTISEAFMVCQSLYISENVPWLLLLNSQFILFLFIELM